MRTGGGTGADPIAGGATAAGAAGTGTAGATAAGGAAGVAIVAVAAAGVLSQQLVELVDLQPADKKSASAATKRPVGQRANKFVFFIIVIEFCGLRFGSRQKWGAAPRSGKRKAMDYFLMFVP